MINFSGFITLNRNIDKEIFKDSKLLTLLIYIALRVKRTNSSNAYFGINLKPREFIIGRKTTAKETDLTENEYRTRINKLTSLKIIKLVKSTNKFTTLKWLDNRFIDLNISINQPTTNQQSTTTNNDNNLISYISSNLIPNSNITYKPIIYIKLLNLYMELKGIKLMGEEKKYALYPIHGMLKSGREPKDILSFMRWLNKYKDDDEYPWIRSWTIKTVQKKLPEFLANKLKIPSWQDELEDIK